MSKIKILIVENNKLRPWHLDWKVYYSRAIYERHDGQIGWIQKSHLYDLTKEYFQQYIDSNYTHIVTIAQGMTFTNRDNQLWYLELEKFINQTSSWVVAGNIIDEYQSKRFNNPQLNADPKKCYYKLWPQVMIINLKQWQDIGSPKLGGPMTVDGQTLNAVKRHKENIHDTYTPTKISKNAKKDYHSDTSLRVHEGWKIINESLRNKLTVYNLPNRMRQYQAYTYPEDDIENYITTLHEYKNLALDNTGNKEIKIPGGHEKLLKVFNKRKSETFTGGFCWYNSEIFYANNIEKFKGDIGTVDCIISPTQGWKELIFSHGKYMQWNHKCDYIHYDFNEDRLIGKKWAVENWDGEVTNIPKKIEQYSLTSGNDTLQWKVPHKRLINEFTDWKSSLLDYQKRKHHYVCINLFDEHILQKITNEIKQQGYEKVLFCTSDIWGWQSNNLHYGVQNITYLHYKTLKTIKKSVKTLVVEANIPELPWHFTKIG